MNKYGQCRTNVQGPSYQHSTSLEASAVMATILWSPSHSSEGNLNVESLPLKLIDLPIAVTFKTMVVYFLGHMLSSLLSGICRQEQYANRHNRRSYNRENLRTPRPLAQKPLQVPLYPPFQPHSNKTRIDSQPASSTRSAPTPSVSNIPPPSSHNSPPHSPNTPN